MHDFLQNEPFFPASLTGSPEVNLNLNLHFVAILISSEMSKSDVRAVNYMHRNLLTHLSHINRAKRRQSSSLARKF